MEVSVRLVLIADDLPGRGRRAGRPSAQVGRGHCLLLVAEALTNVAKHAHAHRATVSASVSDDALRVEVRDDGVGGARIEGSGLVGLRDRVTALHGSFAIDSPRGGGTVVTATIPLDENDVQS